MFLALHFCGEPSSLPVQTSLARSFSSDSNQSWDSSRGCLDDSNCESTAFRYCIRDCCRWDRFGGFQTARARSFHDPEAPSRSCTRYSLSCRTRSGLGLDSSLELVHILLAYFDEFRMVDSRPKGSVPLVEHRNRRDNTGSSSHLDLGRSHPKSP